MTYRRDYGYTEIHVFYHFTHIPSSIFSKHYVSSVCPHSTQHSTTVPYSTQHCLTAPSPTVPTAPSSYHHPALFTTKTHHAAHPTLHGLD